MVPGSRSTRMARGTYLLPEGTQQDSDLRAEISEEGPLVPAAFLAALLVSPTKDTRRDSHKILKGPLTPPPPQFPPSSKKKKKKNSGKNRNPTSAKPPCHFWGQTLGEEGGVKAITGGLIVVHIDSLQLQVTVSVVTASGVDAMLITDDFPKLRHRKTCIRPRPTAKRPATHNEKLGSDSPASPQL